MKLTAKQRWSGLGVALAAAGGLAVFGNDDTLTSAAASAPRLTADTVLKEPIDMTKITRDAPAADGIDLFASKSWYMPPAPIAVAPAKPTAPPLPFAYLGQMEDKQGRKVFLVRDDQLIIAKPGEQLDKKYQLETVSAERLTFMYLPLGERQTLAIGEK